MKQTITPQSNTLHLWVKNGSLCVAVLYQCELVQLHNPLPSLLICPLHWQQTQELSEFHSCNPEIFSLLSHLPLPSSPHPPFLFLIPATLHLCNLAPSKLCYFYTRAGEQSVRAGEWRWCRFPGFFPEHLPPTSPICRHLPRFSLHFLLQSHTRCTRAHT